MGQGISVIIPTKGRNNQISEVMESLAEQTYPILELIFIDDSEEQDSLANELKIGKFIRSNNPHFDIILKKGRKKGIADARNQAVDYAQGEIISFLDDDVVLEKEYYKEMMNSFSDPTIAGVTGVITNIGHQSLPLAIFIKFFFLSTISNNKGFLRRSGFPSILVNYPEQCNVEVMSGCHMAYRKEIFKKYLCDDKLVGYAYMEDIDASYRISREHRLVMNPKCRLAHNTIVKNSSPNYFKMKLSYHRYIFKKHRASQIINLIPYSLSVVGILMEATIHAMKNNEPGFIRAALSGLSRDSRI